MQDTLLRMYSTAFLIVILFLPACSDQGTPLSIQEPVESAYFEEIIQPILNENCQGSGCHIDDTAADMDLSPGHAYENLVNAGSTNYAPALRVVPGDLENSVLWNKITNSGLYGGLMPLTGALTPGNIDKLTAWIAAGAPLTITQ